MRLRTACCLFATAALALMLVGAPARAQPSEQAVKAVFLPKFVRYVTWPEAMRPGGNAPFRLCVIGADPFGPLLDRAAASEIVDGHPVAVERHASADGTDGCHIAFVQGASADRTAALLNALHGHHALTVTDARAGAPRGMVHFVVRDGRVRFFIDATAATDSGLQISSRLLALAAEVRQR